MIEVVAEAVDIEEEMIIEVDMTVTDQDHEAQMTEEEEEEDSEDGAEGAEAGEGSTNQNAHAPTT